MNTTRALHRRRLFWNRVGLLTGIGLLLLTAIGEWLGWWHDVGIVLGAVSIALTVWFGVTSATEATVGALSEPLERMADDMATVRVVLERIATRLGA